MSEQIATEIHKKSTTTKEKHTPKNYTSLLKKGAVITQAALLSLSLSQTNVDVNAQINDKPVDIEQNATTREQEPSEEDWRFQINQLLQTKPFKILEYADKIGQFKWSEEVVLKAIAIKTPQPGFNFNLERAVALLENAEKLHGYTQTVINDVREATENIGSFNCVVLLREADHLSDYSWSSNLLQNLVATSSINMQEFIEHIDNIKNYKWTESTLKKMIEESHNNFNLYITSALTNLFTCSTPETKNIPWFKELIKEEAIWTADNHPEVIIRNSQSLDVLDNIFAEVVIIKALTIMENTGSLSSSTNFNNCMGYLTIFDFAEPFIKRAVDRLKNENPRIIFDHLNILPAYEWFDNMFNDAIRNDPVSALEYYRSFDPGTVAVQKLLETKNDVVTKSLNDIFSFLQSKYTLPTNINEPYRGPMRSNPFEVGLLIENIINDNLSLEEAFNICKNDTLLFHSLLNIKSKDNYIGKISIENKLNNICLRLIQQINTLHDEPDFLRFQTVEKANADELYTLMTYGENEIFTSSFNGLFNRMLTRLQTENLKGDEFLGKIRYDKYRTFIRLCTEFGRMKDFLATMTPENGASLIKRFVEGLNDEPDKLAQTIAVAESVSFIDDPALLEIVQSTMQKEYDRVTQKEDREGEMLYGLLLGKYNLPELTKLQSQPLFNNEGVNVQQYFFYNDKDGQNSFNHLLNAYRTDRNWQIKDHQSYVCIIGTKNNKKIEIYANKPNTLKDKAEEDGNSAIRNELNEKKYNPVIFVHRGHSYHATETLDYIDHNAQFIFFGSCGGYRELETIHERAPEAQFFGTKSTGAMLENDTILKTLNEDILSGKDIVWKDFWEKVLKKLPLSDRITQYVPPHKNLGLLFMKAYNDLLAKSKRQ